ncbi:hypothetical protein GGR52DRAFT_578982 [Hypoxylon sp. FL1284]|nr:hypothetical protein GGR52DRAFT_578982 [Hypoxylon sp. FL1284]
MDDGTYVHPGANQMRQSLSRESNLPDDRRAAATPSSSAYSHEIPTTYASLPPYNYSVPYDTSLPTPVSVAGSPSMHERNTKMMHHYNSHRANSQQPTPPTTSRPWSNYQMNASCSQSGSPITLQAPPPDLLEIQGLETTHSPGDSGQMVTEPHYQWGQYTVSSTEAPEELPQQMTHPSIFSLPSVAPTDLVRPPSMTMTPSDMSLPAPSQVPLLHHSPDPRDLAPSVASIVHAQQQYAHPMVPHNPPVPLHYGPSYRRRPSKVSKGVRSGRVTKKTRPQSKRGNPDFVDPQLSSGANDGSPNTKAPGRSITLGPDAPEKDRFILQLRCQMDNDKGKGIWEEITKKYEERYGKRRQESLQMTLTRAVLKYAEWPESEDQALRLATEDVDRRRYAEIAKVMKEKYGGCQAWEWKEGHILKRLVDLGIEEFDPEDVTKKPRRKSRKVPTKQRPTGNKQAWAVAPNNMSLPYEEDARTFSSEQENYIMEHYCKPEPDYIVPDAIQGVAEHPYAPMAALGSPDKDSWEHQSERVAKHECEKLLAESALSMDSGYHSHMS